MKKIYIDFEMNMPQNKSRGDISRADIIAIGAVKYDTVTKKVTKFKSLIKPLQEVEIYPHIVELTNISTEDLVDAPTYEDVMRAFKTWLGSYIEIEAIYTFGNLDLTCLNNTDKISAKKNNHPRFLNNIRDLFVDIKYKYIDKGIRCINYISLKNLLEYSNIKFIGDAHDPLSDAYNLFLLDKELDTQEYIRDFLIMQDMIRPPFTILNNQLEIKILEYKDYIYENKGNYDMNEVSIEILKTIREYIQSIKQIDIFNIEDVKDISKKLEVIKNLKTISTGYFYILENTYLDIKDLVEDLQVYKLSVDEYKKEIEKIIMLFDEDLEYDNVVFRIEEKELS